MTTEECPFCYQSVPVVADCFDVHYPLEGSKRERETACLGSGCYIKQLI